MTTDTLLGAGYSPEPTHDMAEHPCPDALSGDNPELRMSLLN